MQKPEHVGNSIFSCHNLQEWHSSSRHQPPHKKKHVHQKTTQKKTPPLSCSGTRRQPLAEAWGPPQRPERPCYYSSDAVVLAESALFQGLYGGDSKPACLPRPRRCPAAAKTTHVTVLALHPSKAQLQRGWPCTPTTSDPTR